MSRKLRTTAVGAILAMAALAATGIGVAKPVKSVVGNVETEFGGGFSPRPLPEKKPAPIASFLWGKVRTRDGSHPPALKTLRVVGDKHVELDLKGRPICRLSGRDPRPTLGDIREQCGPSVVGTGRIEVEIAFPEQEPLPIESELLVVKGSASTLYAFASLTVPTPALVVTSIEVKKIHRGRFGTEAIASLPKIAGDYGSVTYFRFNFKRGVPRATCPDGHLDARIAAAFADGTDAPAELTRPCAAKADRNRRG